MEDLKLPCAHQIGDEVELSFGTAGTLKGCLIYGVRFTTIEPIYDISIPTYVQNVSGKQKYTRIKGVSSAFVLSVEPKPATKELQAVLYKMDAYKVTSGFIGTHTKGGQTDFYEEKPSFEMHTWQAITREEVLKMIAES